MKISTFVDLSARELSNLTQIRETSLSKYFNGHISPNVSTIEKIANKLNMKPEDVLTGILERRRKKEKVA